MFSATLFEIVSKQKLLKCPAMWKGLSKQRFTFVAWKRLSDRVRQDNIHVIEKLLKTPRMEKLQIFTHLQRKRVWKETHSMDMCYPQGGVREG